MPTRFVELDYTNHKGFRKTYIILPLWCKYTESSYHVGPQWILGAEVHKSNDLSMKGEFREFAMTNIHSWKPAP